MASATTVFLTADPEAVARHAADYIRAHRAHGVLTCLKHFPGHGSATGDTHLGLVNVTATWSDRELIPFQRLIAAGLCDVIMSAHVFNAHLDPDLPATLSRAVITGLLRERLGYAGVITSDDMEMKAISSHYGLENSLPLAINAGIDAPEKAQAFGNVARKALGELIEGKTVEIQQVDKDRYGRVVANVHVGGGLRGGGGG